MVFHWILSDNKSPRVSRTILSILVDLNNAVVWLVSARPPISKSSSPFTKTLGIVSSAPITTGITVTFVFHSVFLVLKQDLSISFFVFFDFRSVVSQDAKVNNRVTPSLKRTYKLFYFFYKNKAK